MTNVNEPLFGKFDVSRIDGKDKPGGEKEAARYFVLDLVHDPYARVAVRTYIHAVMDEANEERYKELGVAADRHPVVPALAANLMDELLDTEAAHAAAMRAKKRRVRRK